MHCLLYVCHRNAFFFPAFTTPCRPSAPQAVDFIRQQLAANLTPSSVCEALCDKCIAPSTTGSNGIGCDNMSAVLVVFKSGSAAR